jgi:hypothetical protein
VSWAGAEPEMKNLLKLATCERNGNGNVNGNGNGAVKND